MSPTAIEPALVGSDAVPGLSDRGQPVQSFGVPAIRCHFVEFRSGGEILGARLAELQHVAQTHRAIRVVQRGALLSQEKRS